MASIMSTIIRLCEGLPYAVLALLARFAMARIFFDSGQTKLGGTARCFRELACAKLNPLDLQPSAVALFAEEYHMPFPWLAAHLAALAEFTLPIMLLAGLASRLSALGLLAMTLVIEIFVYPGSYVLHAGWATILLMIAKFGPGIISLDHLVAKR